MPDETYPEQLYSFLALVERSDSRTDYHGLSVANLNDEQGILWELALHNDLLFTGRPQNPDGSYGPDEASLSAKGRELLARYRLRKAAELAPASPAPPPAEVSASGPPAPAHSPDFTTLDYRGTRYTFSKGQQAHAVRVLWEAAGHSLTQETIGDKVGSDATRFRLGKLFHGHPAWGALIVQDGKGCYRIPQ